jgi:hypothetical protein
VVSRLDVLGSEFVFDRIAKIVDDYGGSPEDSESLWEAGLEEASRMATSLSRDFFRARVEYHLHIGTGGIDSVEELVDAHPDVPEVLEEAARMRFHLASETTRRVYRAELKEVEAQCDWAEENLWSLVEAGEESEDSGAWVALGPVTLAGEERVEPRVAYRRAIGRAERRVQKAKSKLQALRRTGDGRHYKKEVEQALKWALRAERLGADRSSIRELIAQMRWEMHADEGAFDVASDGARRRVDRAKLRRVLSEYFNESELRNLCFDLRIDYEMLGGEGRGDKVRELITYCERHGRYQELVDTCCERRPNAPW